MFGSRKYTPLPTNANGNVARKRSGGGMPTWKKALLVGGGATLVVLALGGYHGVGRSKSNEATYEEDSECHLVL